MSICPQFVTPVDATGARDASITLTANPQSQSVEKGETAEYTVTVRNTGSEDISVSLQTSEDTTDNACNGYTSSIEQITETIGAGASASTTMYVNLTSTAGESCETTVRATATEQVPGSQPAIEEATVTT